MQWWCILKLNIFCQDIEFFMEKVWPHCLTGLNEMADILQTTSSNAFFVRKFWFRYHYRKTSSISRTISPNVNVSCLVLQLSLPNSLKPGVKLRTNEDVVGAAPTGDAPTTSELSTIIWPKVRLILEVLRYTFTVLWCRMVTPGLSELRVNPL